MATNTAADLPIAGVMSRSPEEITRVLTTLLENRQAVRCNLAAGKMLFESRVLFVDPAHTCILLEAGTNELATAALLARPRASFHASSGSWHVEFSAARPQRAVREGSPAIRLLSGDPDHAAEPRVRAGQHPAPRAAEICRRCGRTDLL